MVSSDRRFRGRSVGVWRRLGLPKPQRPEHSQSFLSPLAYVSRCLGGKDEFMRLARLSTDERVRGLVSRWDSLSRSDRRYISLEDLCEASGVEAADLYGAVVAASYARGLDFSPLL